MLTPLMHRHYQFLNSRELFTDKGVFVKINNFIIKMVTYCTTQFL